MAEKVYTPDDVESLLTKYLQNEVELKEVALKAFIKVLLFDVLHLSTVGISNKNRSMLYNYVVTNIFTFKQEHPLETSSKSLKKWLVVSVNVKIDELSVLSGEKQRSKSTDSFKPLLKIKVEKDAASGSSVGEASNEVSRSNSRENLHPNNEKESEAPAIPVENNIEKGRARKESLELNSSARRASSSGSALIESNTRESETSAIAEEILSNEAPESTDTLKNEKESEAPAIPEEDKTKKKASRRARKESLESNSSAGRASSAGSALIESNSRENLLPKEEILSNEAPENTDTLNNEKESEAPSSPEENKIKKKGSVRPRKESLESNSSAGRASSSGNALIENNNRESGTSAIAEEILPNEVPALTGTLNNEKKSEATDIPEENKIKKKGRGRPRKKSRGSNSSVRRVSSSGSSLVDRANTFEFQPVVPLNSKECAIELEKLNKKRDASNISDSPKVAATDALPTSSGQIETPMVEIPASVFQFGQPSPEEVVEVEKKPKPKKKIGPKKIKQRRPTNKHYSIKTFFTSLESHSKKQNALEINIVPNKLCNFSFQVHPETFDLSMRLEEVAETQPVTGLTIKKLLYWPGVGVRLSLPEMEIVRYCNANVHRELVSPHVDLGEDVLHGNKKGLFRFYKNKTLQSINPPEKDVELSQIMVLTYLQLVLKALSVTKFPKEDQLREILKSFLSDLSKINQCYLKTCFSYFCNSYSYYREFRPKSELDDNKLALVLRETYNPEIVFTITRCNFEADGIVLTDMLTEYFKAILFDENPEAIRDFNNMLNKGYSVHCVECKDDQNGQFAGPMKIALLSEHLGEVCTNELTCVKCNYHNNINDLSNQQWKHECISPRKAR